MKKSTLLFISAAFLAMTTLYGDSFTLSPSGQRQWQSPLYSIPSGRPPMQILIKSVTTEQIQHSILLRWLDRDGKPIGTSLPRPPFHYPVDELLNKPVDIVQTILPQFYPPNAEKVQILIGTSDFRSLFPALPPPGKTTFEEPKIRWIYRVKAEKTLNWFDMTEPVAFTALLPPGVEGLRGVVSDSDGKNVADITCKGNRWIWRSASPGFYKVNFFHIAKDGKQLPVSESFYGMLYDKKNGFPVRLKKEAKVFTRDFQNFAVTEKREKTGRSHPFGANIQLPNEHDPYFIPLNDSFIAAQLCGLNSFIRWHAARWNEIERQRGIYDWSIVDRFLKEAEKSGFSQDKIILNTFGTPRWNSPKPQNTLWSTHYSFFAPLDLKPWSEYLKAFSKRYPGIRMWELWNEPHLPGGSIFWQESSPEQFVELMKTGYKALKLVNPENTVIHGGIGMRYMPFYDAVTKLGIQNWYDKLGTHVVDSHEPFVAIDRKYGVKTKPFVETEWHTNLYNCNAPILPSEEDLCFRMLIQLAQMLNMEVDRIAAFNMFTGAKVPETARYFGQEGGIQQVTGLFRSVPFKEPRLSALVLRIATDRFSGKIKPLGARYFGDGNQQIALFESNAGKVAFFLSQEGKGPLVPAKEIAAQLKQRTVLDWEGRKTAPEQLKVRRVYFILNPDPAILNAGHPLKELSPRPKYQALDKSVWGTYAPLSTPLWHPVKRHVALNKKNMANGFAARFAASFAADGLHLLIEVKDSVHHPECNDKKVWEADSVQFAIDAVGKGDNADVLEFAAGKNGLIYKVRTPVLNGDLPVEYSEAGVPLRNSTAQITRSEGKTLYRIHILPKDLYPFIYRENQAVRFSLLVNNNDGGGREGYSEWGSGIGGIKAPHLFGTLFRKVDSPVEFGRWRIFQNGKLKESNPIRLETVPGKEDKASGISCRIGKVVPGGRYRIAFRARGNGRLHAMVYGKNLKRLDFPIRNRLALEWREYSLIAEIPENETELNLAVFFWKEKNAYFELKDWGAKSGQD